MKELSKWQRKLWLLGMFKIPMLGFVKPKLLALDNEQCQVVIRLSRRSKNHLDSMYFGALAVGADLAPGLLTYYLAEKEGLNINFLFKSMHCEFIQRAESDVRFVCSDALQLKEAIDLALKTNDRQNLPLVVKAYNNTNEEVANFTMEVSFRIRN
ncbi:MAG: DUF4442 domain-containing protein [Bacteroidetes bacterium]|nr:MAG: DUF4442 domain-containing protein [Bacteroidota bacterium]